jgi:hypothetical protein
MASCPFCQGVVEVGAHPRGWALPALPERHPRRRRRHRPRRRPARPGGRRPGRLVSAPGVVGRCSSAPPCCSAWRAASATAEHQRRQQYAVLELSIEWDDYLVLSPEELAAAEGRRGRRRRWGGRRGGRQRGSPTPPSPDPRPQAKSVSPTSPAGADAAPRRRSRRPRRAPVRSDPTAPPARHRSAPAPSASRRRPRPRRPHPRAPRARRPEPRSTAWSKSRCGRTGPTSSAATRPPYASTRPSLAAGPLSSSSCPAARRTRSRSPASA